MSFFRNLESGAIKELDSASDEWAKLRLERTESGRFPLYEQTGAHDADPDKFAEANEVARRSQWPVPNHDVTSDGVGISDKAKAELAKLEDEPAPARASAKK